MALLDFLKKKEDAEKSKPAKKAEKALVASPTGRQAKKSTPEKKTEKPKPAAQAPTSKKGSAFSFEAIKEPHISEKATYLAEKNQYTFKISPRYNKHEVKKAVEGLYQVNVLAVNMIKIPQKKRRLGRTEGFKKAYAKAVVTIKEGQKIEIL